MPENIKGEVVAITGASRVLGGRRVAGNLPLP